MAALAEILRLAEAWLLAGAGVFARIGAVVFLLPGLGERTIPVRVKLSAALALTVLVLPLIAPALPTGPAAPRTLLKTIAAEAAAGLAIGTAFRLLVWMLQTAGSIAANHLSVAQMFGSGVAAEAEPALASLLAMGGIALAMASGLPVAVVAALADLYAVLPFGRFPAASDLATWSVAAVGETFGRALSLALPFVAIAFAYNLALGALARAMPQLLVALVGAPLLVGLGLLVLHVALPEIFATWSLWLAATLADPFGRFD